jgi:hypothetical protein
MTHINYRQAESGNVLFLILIAVILFAALSYAVTGTIGQPNDKSSSIDVIGSAEITQYPTQLRISIMDMMLDGVDEYDLEFNTPSDFASLSRDQVGVFHPAGGGAPYQHAGPNVMSSGAQGKWYFNAEFEIQFIGISDSGDAGGNDIIAFLPGVKESVCRKINEKEGITGGIPALSIDASSNYQKNMDSSYVIPSTELVLGTDGSNGSDSLMAQPMGCFQNNNGEFVYYQLLVQR